MAVMLVAAVSTPQARAADEMSGVAESGALPAAALGNQVSDQGTFTRHVYSAAQGKVVSVESFYGHPEIAPQAIAGDAELVPVYSNPDADILFPPGVGRAIADDIFTTPGCDCQLNSYEFLVGAENNGTGGPFSVEFALYDNCPNINGEIVPGTDAIVALPDDGVHLIVVDLTGLQLSKGAAYWLRTEFSRAGAGWYCGTPAQIGYSADRYDFPGFPCTAQIGGGLYASFYANMYCEPSNLAEASEPLPPDNAMGVVSAPLLSWNSSAVASASVALPELNTDWESELAPGQHCATQERYMANNPDHGSVAGGCFMPGTCDEPDTRDFFIPNSSTAIKEFRLSFRVFCFDNGSGCVADEGDIATEVATLNADYSPWNIQFVYEYAEIADSEYRNYQSDEESAMKMTYADSPASKLNIFVTTTSGFSVGTFPWDPVALGPLGGIVLHSGHLGTHIVSHEVGHNLGLWHTHHGVSEVQSCSACWERADGIDGDITGDFCSDTAPTPVNFNCGNPGGTDQCSNTPWGETDYPNYMSYAPSSCQDHFSVQQAGRMHCWSQDRLEGWMDLEICGATYDVYGGSESPPEDLLCEDTLETQCQAPEIADDSDYYWQVVTKRDVDVIPGPIWSFSTGGLCMVTDSEPQDCSVDARQPHDPPDANVRYGWKTVDVTLGCDPTGLGSDDFSVMVDGGPAPTIESIETSGAVATITLSDPILPGQWTCVIYDGSGDQVCLGYLPGDVSGDLVTTSDDIGSLITAIEGAGTALNLTDMNRDGALGPEDLLRLIDIMNGGEEFMVGLDATIGACP
jgi:hypothetical protein